MPRRAPANDPGSSVQRPAPARIPRLTEFVLPLERVRPFIRIAHRLVGGIETGERILTDHELVLILRGEGELVTREGAIALGPHHLLAIPPFFPHRIHCSALAGSMHPGVSIARSATGPSCSARPGWPPSGREPPRII